MENNKVKNTEDKLNQFLNKENNDEETDNVVLLKTQQDGLFERVDKTLMTADGRQLLR